MKDSFCLKTLKKAGSVKKIISSIMLVTFLTSLIVSPAGAQLLPVPGTPVALSAGFQPPVLMGLKIHPENPLLFDFIVDQGATKLSDDELKLETEKLVKYFLAALTIPDKEVWVNLSPYEKDKVIPDALGQTTMGKTMLEQDYMLKQLASSLTNPDEKLGRDFWANVKNQVQAQLKTADVPMSTFNKVWIVPQKAEVLESEGIVLVGEKRLKVMMDQDYLAMEKNGQADSSKAKDVNTISSGIFKETVLPSIEKEINEGKNFADVRQIYNSVILATWYKKALKESLLGKVYADKGKVAGVETDDKQMKQKIYEQYLAAFRKGVYNLIREESDSSTGDTIPRKYFSGGIKIANFTASSSLAERAISVAQAGQLIEGAASKAVRVQMAEPKTNESSVIASSSLLPADTQRIPAGQLGGPDTISSLLALFERNGIRYQELMDYINPLIARLRAQQQPITQSAIQIYINEQTLADFAAGKTAMKELGLSKTHLVTGAFNEWMNDLDKNYPDFLLKSEPLAWLLAAVLDELKQPKGLRGHYLTEGAHLYIPLTDQSMSQIIFGNDRVNVLFSEGKLIFSEGVIGSQTSARYIAQKDEFVYIGRDLAVDHVLKLPLKDANLTVSQTHFSARLRDLAGHPYLEVIDGDASKLLGSTNGTLVLNWGIAPGDFRLVSGANVRAPIQTPKSVELGARATAGRLEVSGTFAQGINVTAAYVPIEIGVANDKLWLRVAPGSPEYSRDGQVRFLEFGKTYVVNRFDPDVPVDITANKIDLKVSGNSGISRKGNFELTVVRNGRYFDFTVKDLQTPNATSIAWIDIKASSAVTERTPSDLLTSIADNAKQIDEMLADFEKPGVEVSDQFKQQLFQWKDNVTVLQQQAVAIADQQDLASIEQQITVIKNTIERSFHIWIKQGSNAAFKNWKPSNSYDYQGKVMYHVVPLSAWKAQKNGDYYRSDRFAADGFIHFSADVDTALAIANRAYGTTDGEVVVLKVNALATTGSGRLAVDNGQSKFPHLYGAMPTGAVVGEIVLGKNKDGALEMVPDILQREQIAASSSIRSDEMIAALQVEAAALGIDAVRGSANVHSYTSPDDRNFVARLFRDKDGKEFTVIEVFENENEVTDFTVITGNFINLPAAELWAKYEGASAASSGLLEAELNAQFEALSLTYARKAKYGGTLTGPWTYLLQLYQNPAGKFYTLMKVHDTLIGHQLVQFRIFEGDVLDSPKEVIEAMYYAEKIAASSAIIMDSGKTQEGKLAVQFQRDDEGVILTDGKLVAGDTIDNRTYMRAYRVSTFDFGRQVKIISGRYFPDAGSFDVTGGGGAYTSEYLGLPDRPVVDSVTLKAQAINSPFGLEVTVSKGDAKSFNYQAKLTTPPAAAASSAISPVLKDSFLVNGYSQGAIASDIMNRNVVSFKKEDVVAAMNAAGKSENVEDLAAIVTEYENAATTQIYTTRAYQLLNNPAFRDSFMAAYVGKNNNYSARLENQAKDAAAILKAVGQNVDQLAAEFDSSYKGEPALKDIRAKRDLINRAGQFINASSGVGKPVVASAATVDANKFTKGGIDFDPAAMNLQIKRDGKGVPLPLPQQNLEQINIEGLIPIIINIVPINAETLPILLGQGPKEPGKEIESAMNAAS